MTLSWVHGALGVQNLLRIQPQGRGSVLRVASIARSPGSSALTVKCELCDWNRTTFNGQADARAAGEKHFHDEHRDSFSFVGGQ